MPLHKFLTGEGERRVRAVEADHEEAKRSITLVKVARRCRDFTLLDVTIKTGRTTRSACTWRTRATPSSATPSTATSRSTSRWRAARRIFERMFLHAQRLRFQHPPAAR